MPIGEARPEEQVRTDSQPTPKVVGSAIHWPRIVAEGVAIVASILLAFALNAWWDGVRANQNELITLRGLRADFAANAAELDRARRATEEVQAVADSILNLTGPEGSSVTELLATRLVANLLRSVPPFDPVEGTLGSLLASQGLGSISNPALRLQLAKWPQTTAPIEIRAQRISAYFDERLLPYLQSRIPVRTLDAVGASEFGARRSRFPLSVEGLLREVDFENLVNDFYFHQSSMLGAIAAARAATDSIIVLIDQDPRTVR